MCHDFLMWGERGFVTTLLLDLTSFQTPDNISNFLNEIELANGNKIQFEPQKIRCIIEPDFGREGFGTPDAIIILENINQEKIIIIFEAKLSNYGDSSKNPSLRGTDKFNSTINGQLELNYCLALAMSEFTHESSVLEEPSWILKTRYNVERNGKLRIMKDVNIIENMVKPFAISNICSYYHIILTDEISNPLIKNVNLPELYDENDIDKWDIIKSNFGWINYIKLRKFAENYLKDGRFLDTFELNSGNLDSLKNPLDASKGVLIIYAPSINDKVLFHFSWKNDVSVLRNYKDKSSNPDKISYTKSEVLKKIKNIFIPDNIRNIDDIQFWYDYIQKLYNQIKVDPCAGFEKRNPDK